MKEYAWQITAADVIHVLDNHGLYPDTETVAYLLQRLDRSKVESAAWRGREIQEQIALSRKEIERQLAESGMLGKPVYPIHGSPFAVGDLVEYKVTGEVYVITMGTLSRH